MTNKKNSSVETDMEDITGGDVPKTEQAKAGKQPTVVMHAPSMPPKEQEREMTMKEAEKLMKYEQASGKQNWFIKEGQSYTFEDGNIRSTDQGSAENIQQ
jgi:hypothetical protein